MRYLILFGKVFLALSCVMAVVCPVFGAGAVGTPNIASRYSYMVAADGVPLGICGHIIEGGAINAEVVLLNEAAGAVSQSDLHLIGKEQYSDVTVQYTAISQACASWINDTWVGIARGRSLRIACLSPDGTMIWDRTFSSAQVRELVIQDCVRGTVNTPNGMESRIIQPRLFAVKFMYGSIVDSTGPFPTSPSSNLDYISIGDLDPTIALDGVTAFTTSAHEPISIKMAPLAQFGGYGTADSASNGVSIIVVSVPFAYAGGLLSWAKEWLPGNFSDNLRARADLVEKNGSMVWKSDTGVTTCTLSLKNVGVCEYEYTADSETNPLAKVRLYCENARFLTDGASSTGSPGILVNVATTEEGAGSTKIAGTRRYVALVPSNTSLGKPHKLGAFELVVKSAKYSMTPLTVAEEEMVPSADQKLFVVTYTLRNAATDEQKVDMGTLAFQAFDVSGATYNDFKVGIGTRMARIFSSMQIKNDILTFSAVTIIPADESIAKLRITNPSDISRVEYTFAAK